MEIIMAIGDVGISNFDKNFTFSSRYSLLQGFSKTPNSRISLNTHKFTKNRIFIAKPTELVDNAMFIHKQTDFQPAFHEYLKAMESVKTDRENKPLKDANSGDNPTVKYVWRAPRERLEEDGERMEAGSEPGVWIRHKGVNSTEPRSRQRGNGFYKNTSNRDMGEGFSRITGRGSNHDLTGRSKIELEDKSNRVVKDGTKFGRREGFSKKGVIERNQGSVHLKLEQKGNGTDLRDRGGFRENEVNGRAEKINHRTWTNTVTTKNQRVPDRKANAVKRLENNEDLHGGNLDQQRKYTDVWKKPLSSNKKEVTTQVGNTGRAGDFVGISKWNSEKQQSYSSSIGNKTSESTLDQTLIEWEGVSTNFSKMELGETNNWKTEHTKSSDRSKVGRQIYDSDIRVTKERANSYNIQGGIRPNRNEYEAEKLGSRSTNVDMVLDRDHIHTEDNRHKALRSGNFSSGRKSLKEHDGENDMEMERAAFKSFEVFTDLRGQPRVLRMEMEERIQHLAKWLNGTDINMPEWLFSKMIHSARIRFSDHSILRVIQILGSLGNWRRALQVIEWFQSRERFKSYKSRYIYTAALDVLGKAKRPVEALYVFHLMRQGMSSYPDLAAYHCIAVTLGQAGYLKELFDVIDCMRSPPPTKFKTGFVENWDPRLEPDIIIYNAVLNACARRKQWEGAFWVLQQLKQQGLQPSSTTYGLTMEVMFACEKYNLVYEFFRKVEKSTIPNSLNYKVLVNSLWKEGKTDDAVFAVEDMERRGIVGSASLYYDLARCLCTAGRCQEALMQMDKICKVAHKPLVVTYTGLIQSCLDAGNVQNGAYIFKQMQEFCSPNLVTCNIMLKAYLEHRMWEDAKDLFQKMLDESCHIQRRSDLRNIVTPDSYTFNTMLDAYAAEQKWDDFSYVFQHMLHRGHKFNTKRHLRHILEACRAGQGELLETTWKDLIQANRLPPPPLVKERFCMKLEESNYTAAISSITIHMTNDPPLQAFTEKGWLDLLKMNTDRFQKDTIVRLTHELNNLVAGSHQPHPVILNLISSCREFVRTHYIADEINPKPIEIKEHNSIVNLVQ